MLTISLSELRRGPHSALLDTGGDGHGPGFACGRLSLGEPLIEEFLGMWRCSTRPDLAELLPFDADAGSSSNMVSSQPGVTLGLQSWEIDSMRELCSPVFDMLSPEAHQEGCAHSVALWTSTGPAQRST